MPDTRLICFDLDDTLIREIHSVMYLSALNNIANVIAILRKLGFKCILITAGPKQVAKVACNIWGMDEYFGSDYEIAHGKFTGKIIKHIGDKGKILCLQEYCNKYKINSDNCIAIGDGASDIPLFEYCGTSIAINYSNVTIGKATYYINTDDLSDILNFIVR